MNATEDWARVRNACDGEHASCDDDGCRIVSCADVRMLYRLASARLARDPERDDLPAAEAWEQYARSRDAAVSELAAVLGNVIERCANALCLVPAIDRDGTFESAAAALDGAREALRRVARG